MSSGKKSVARLEYCKMNGYRWRRGAPWKKLAPSLAPVHKKLAPPLIDYREGNKANSSLPLDVQKLKAF